MKNILKNSLKVFWGYVISLVVFVLFLYTVISFSKENFGKWVTIYSFVIFLLMFGIIYSDLNNIGRKEVRPQYDLNPHPLKGFIYGMIGFVPFILLQVIYPFISFQSPIAERVKELVLKTLLGPLYWILNIGNNSVIAYIIASAAVPVIAMLGYLSGYHKFSLIAFTKGLSKKKTQ